MKYKVTLNQKVYEVEVEAGKAVLLDEYEACAPAPAAAPAVEAAPAAAAAPAPAPAAKVDLKAGEPVKSPMPLSSYLVGIRAWHTGQYSSLSGICAPQYVHFDIISSPFALASVCAALFSPHAFL